MGRYVRKCKGSVVMEKASENGRRKRKIVLPTSSIQLKTCRLAVERLEDSASPASSGNSTCESVTSGYVLESCCSSTRSSELSTKFADLENQETSVATSAGRFGDSFRREKTPWSEVEADMPLESPFCAAEKMPTEAELEEFLAAAEANLQKQFIDKYNYNIVKDKPLEGRYEWVPIQMKPSPLSKS